MDDAKLVSFLSAIAGKYRVSNFYHNFHHAFFVAHRVYKLLTSSEIYPLTQREMLCLLIAAVCHDVDHPGTDNDFEISTGSELAITYNDMSVLENHHAATCFRTAQSEDCDVFSFLSKEDFRKVREMVIDSILATDMKNHFTLISKIEQSNALQVEHYETLAMNLILHAADVGSLLTPIEDSMAWTSRIVAEFQMQASRCEEEGINVPAHMKDLQDEKKQAKLQTDFLDYIVAPLWNLVIARDPEQLHDLKEYLDETRSEFLRRARDDEDN